MTIELPLKNPEEILDMQKINNILDTNFVNTLDNQQRFEKFKGRTLDDLSNEAFFQTSVLKNLTEQILNQISHIKGNYSERLTYKIVFPSELVQERPEIPAQWEATRTLFNAFHDDSFATIQTVEKMIANADCLSTMTLELIKNGYPQNAELQQTIEKLSVTIENMKRESELAILGLKTDYDKQIEKFRAIIHDKDKLMAKKDAVSINLQKQLDLINEELNQNRAFLLDANFQVQNKYTDFQEMNKYISELFKEKNRLLGVVEQKDKQIEALKLEVEGLKKRVGFPAIGIGFHDQQEVIEFRDIDPTLTNKIDHLDKQTKFQEAEIQKNKQEIEGNPPVVEAGQSIIARLPEPGNFNESSDSQIMKSFGQFKNERIFNTLKINRKALMDSVQETRDLPISSQERLNDGEFIQNQSQFYEEKLGSPIRIQKNELEDKPKITNSQLIDIENLTESRLFKNASTLYKERIEKWLIPSRSEFENDT